MLMRINSIAFLKVSHHGNQADCSQKQPPFNSFPHRVDALDGNARSNQTQNDISLLNALEVISSLPVRADLDFTEKLWNFCSTVSSEDDLRAVLGATFDLLDRGEIFPMVHKSNESALAGLVRDAIKLSRTKASSRDHNEQRGLLSQTFQSWLSRSLQCTIETGLCKLKRDYVHYLVGNDVATWEDLVRKIYPTPHSNFHHRSLTFTSLSPRNTT